MKYSILHAWTQEFKITDQKVESVHHSTDLLRIRFKNKRDLLLVTGAKDAFPFWTDTYIPANPEETIWNQVTHATLSYIRIAENDRVLFFGFDQTDIYQQQQKFVVIAEFTPPQPNIILAVQQQELIIIDALKKYSYADNPQRQVLPRLPYQPAKTTFVAERQDLTLPMLIEPVKGGEALVCADVNTYLLNYYQSIYVAGADLQRQKSARLHWERELKKAQQKLKKQNDELQDAEKAQYWQICAETLKHNLHNIQKGQTSLQAVNYFDPNLGSIEIPLSADKSPQQNLQYYLKKYHKAKRGAEIIRQNISATELTISQLQNVLARIDLGEFTDLPGGKNVAGLGRKLDQIDKLLKFRLSDEFEIVIGRRAKENDFITTQLAQGHDWWFHTRIYHGSHILLRCFKKTTPDPALIRICCSLAAWYSKARFSINVPVDYTQIRFVRKPRKSAPGFVTYTTHQTVFANPKDLRTVREELQA